MSSARDLSAVVAASAALLSVGPSAAQGEGPTAPSPPVPSVPAPVPSAPAPPPPAPASIKLVVQRASGNPLFVLDGRRMVIRAVVRPYVAGQQVKVSIYREGRKVKVRIMNVRPAAHGTGQFHLDYTTTFGGVVQVRAAHYATAEQAAFSGRSPSVQFVNPALGPGSSGASVRLLQSELNALHYVVPLNGSFDEGTGRAVIAFRKVTGMARVSSTNAGVFQQFERGAGSFHVHYGGDGRHVEADLTAQVLVEIEAGGQVRAIYTMSSGKPSTPTVIGHFSVYSKTPGENAKGMVDSNYFIRGYAIHGYHEVPTYAASHGCLRVPIPDAASIFGWVQMGTPVDVYNESGGGSNHVNGNAGP